MRNNTLHFKRYILRDKVRLDLGNVHLLLKLLKCEIFEKIENNIR